METYKKQRDKKVAFLMCNNGLNNELNKQMDNEYDKGLKIVSNVNKHKVWYFIIAPTMGYVKGKKENCLSKIKKIHEIV